MEEKIQRQTGRFSDRKFLDANCNPTTLDGLCRSEPGWAANRIRVLECAVAELLELADRHRVVLPRNYQSKEESYADILPREA